MFTLPGDFFDMNDAYPMLSKSSTRRRVYVSIKNDTFWELVRFEFTSDILDMYNHIHIPVPKLWFLISLTLMF